MDHVTSRDGTQFSTLLRSSRQRAQLTQEELASRAGVSVASIRDLEQRRRLGPRRRSLAGIIRALGLDDSQATALMRAARDAGATPDPGRQHSAGRVFRLQVLGPLVLELDGEQIETGPPRQRAVLGLLALHPGSRVRRETIIDALWGADPPITAVNLVQTYISRLRRKLNAGNPPRGRAGMLVSDGVRYGLQPETRELDLLTFRDLCERARAAWAAGELPAARDAYTRAIGMWQDDPLAGIDVLQGHPATAAVGRERLTAVLDHASVCEQIGEPQQALQNLWAITAREPLHEPAHVRLMIALASSGEQAAALHVYEDIRLRLDRELGVYPSPELADAHMQVLNRAASPAPVAVLGAQHSRNRATGYHGRAVGQAVRPQQLPTAVPHFVGRTQELTALTKMLDHAGGCRSAVISAIGGTAGIGKTALAVHWAHETADRFRDGQLYVNLRGFDPAAEPMSASEVVRGFLDALGVQPEQIPADLTAQVGLYRSLLADMQMLVLLDNARDEEQVRPLLPGGTACMAVVTSRRRLPGLVAEGAQPIMLDVLADQEARDLLAHRIGLERVAAETDAVDAVIELCARLPLGLSITAAHAAVRPGITVKALAAQLRDVRHRLDALETGDVATGMRAVFSCSYRGLDAEEARMFRLMGVHPGPDISAHAAASLAAVPPWRARQMLLTLTVANLLSEISPGRFAFHDLLRVYSREQARATDSDAHRRAAVGRMLDHYLLAADTADLMLRPDREPLLLPAIAPGVTPERLADERQSRNWFGVEHRVLIAAITMAADMGFDTHTWQLAWALGSFLDWRGHWPEWTTTQTVALAAARRLGDLTGQARTHWELGRAFVRLCSYVDARSHMYDALAIYEKLGDVVGQANSHYGLSEAFGREGVMIASDGQGSAAGPYAASLDHGQQALSLYRSASHHTGQAKALNGIGWCHALREEYRPALGYCQQALQLLRGSDERVLAGAVLDSLGYIHSHRGDYRQAVARYEEAAKLFHERGHHHEAEVLTHLGDAHHAAGNDQSARDAWRQALTILRRLHQPDAEKVRAKLRGIHAAASKDIGT